MVRQLRRVHGGPRARHPQRSPATLGSTLSRAPGPEDLPQGGDADTQKQEVKKTIEISPKGAFKLDGRNMALSVIEKELVRAYEIDKDMVIYIRVDEEGRNKHLYDVIDVCQRNNLTKFSLRTRPKL